MAGRRLYSPVALLQVAVFYGWPRPTTGLSLFSLPQRDSLPEELKIIGKAQENLMEQLASSQGAHGEPKIAGAQPFLAVLEQLAGQHGTDQGELCLGVPGPFMGRLSNTVSMMNVVLRAALTSGATFYFPQHYTAWMEQEGLDNIFGTLEDTCAAHEVQVYSPLCPPGEKKYASQEGRCSINELLLDTAAWHTVNTTLLCDCKRAVIVNGLELFWDHDFSMTHDILNKRYWQSHSQSFLLPSTPGSLSLENPQSRPKRQVVVHVRLGDVESHCLEKFTEYNCKKRLEAQTYTDTLSALLAVLPPSCIEVNLVTDGQRSSPDILYIQKNLSDAGTAPRIWTEQDLCAAKSFEFMTHADVLIYGSSGFGQLAAVLSRPVSARVGAPMPSGYNPDPLKFLANTTQLHLPRGTSDAGLDAKQAVAALAENAAIQALARHCREHA